MAIYTLFDDKGIIVNNIEWDGVAPYDHPENHILRKGIGGPYGNIGWKWDGTKAVDPNPPPPKPPAKKDALKINKGK